MAIGSLINLAGSVVQSIFHGNSNSTTGNSTPFAQVLSSLQEVQQSSPAEYQSITQKISTGLANGAKAATAIGDTHLAGQLSRLSADFTVASNSGQLPNAQDLASAFPNSRMASPAASIIGSTISHIRSV